MINLIVTEGLRSLGTYKQKLQRCKVAKFIG